MGRRKNGWHEFSKEVVEENEDAAVEKLLSLLGSKHRVKRTNIEIRETEEIPEEEVEDPYIQDLLQQED